MASYKKTYKNMDTKWVNFWINKLKIKSALPGYIDKDGKVKVATKWDKNHIENTLIDITKEDFKTGRWVNITKYDEEKQEYYEELANPEAWLIPGGARSRLIEIDIDLNHNEGRPGDEVFKEFCEDLPQEEKEMLKSTLIIKTPSGGYHLILSSDTYLNKTTGILENVDLLASNGVIVLPGSKAVRNGEVKEYTPIDEEAEIKKINDMPVFLKKLTALCRDNNKSSEKKSNKVIKIENVKNKWETTTRTDFLLKQLLKECRALKIYTLEGITERFNVLNSFMLRPLGSEPDDKPTEPQKIIDSAYKYLNEDTKYIYQAPFKAFITYVGTDLKYIVDDDKDNMFLHWDGKAWIKKSLTRIKPLYGELCEEVEREYNRELPNKETKADIKALDASYKKFDSAKACEDTFKMLKTKGEYMLDLSTYSNNRRILATKDGQLINSITGEIRAAKKEDFIIDTHECKLVDITESMEFVDRYIIEPYSERMPYDSLMYLLNFIAYKITGGKSCQQFIQLKGDGATGKSLFVNLITDLMDKYVKQFSIRYLKANNKEDDRDDLIPLLDGIRLGIVSEPKQNAILENNRIKELLSGNRKVNARGSYGKIKENDLSCLDFIVDTNHDITYDCVDSGLLRRVSAILLYNPIKKEDIVLDYYDRVFKPNLDKVFTYLVYKGIEIHHQLENGKTWADFIPQSVKDSTNEYLKSIDSVTKFALDYLEPCEGEKCNIDDIAKSYRDMCVSDELNSIFEDVTNSIKEKKALIGMVRNIPGFNIVKVGQRDEGGKLKTSQGKYIHWYPVINVKLKNLIKVDEESPFDD